MGTTRPPRPAYPAEFRARAVELARAAELVRLRREVALLREERDILQKATAYFARASAPR